MTAEQVAKDFLKHLEEMDLDAWIDLWAEDGRQEMPFAPKGFPREVVGKDALYKHYSDLPNAYDRMAFPDLVVRPMQDPEWALAEYRGEIDFKKGGSYNNTYAGLFHVQDGKLKLFREYFDPNVLIDSFGGEAALQAAFNVNGKG